MASAGLSSTPVPDEFPDPFSSTGPFAGPPETWQELASSDDGRRRALALGRRHGQLVQSLRDLSEENGGGLGGMGRGMLGRLEQQHLITGHDRERLTALLEHLRASVGASSGDEEAALSKLHELHEAIVEDAASSPFAVALSAVALDSVTQALTTEDDYAAGFAAGYTDAIGFLTAGFGGPLAAMSMSVAVSSIAVMLTP